jgi:hypothetical protein
LPKAFVGEPARQVIESRGVPPMQLWIYSKSPSGASYRERLVYLRDRQVERSESSFYID